MNAEQTIVSPNRISETDLLETAIGLGPILSKYVDDERSNRRLSRPVFNALKESNFLKLFLPKSLGGVEADPLTTAKVVLETSRHNTTAGWCMMVANVSTFWCNRLSEKGVEEIYRNGPDTFIAGAFHPPMKATPVKDGYQINGRSPLTSHVHEADWIFVSAFVMEEGQMKMHNGIPVIIGVFMNATDCQILDTWYTIGMCATDSNDIVAKDVFVPDHLSYLITPEFEANEYYAGPLYRYPAIGAGIACLISPIALAVAQNAIKELKILADKKVPFGSSVAIRDRGTVQRKLGMAEAFVQSSRAYLYQTITDCWNRTTQGEKLSPEDRAVLLLAVTHTNQTCLQAVELMYSSAGTSGIYTANKLATFFTDAQVIRHHGFSNESRYETAAQLLLGLPPDLPVVMF